MAAPTDVSSHAEFNKALSNTTFVAVDFHATWCGPCHAIAPMYSKLASSLTIPGQLQFLRVDVDAVPSVAAQYDVTAMPTFLFFQNGKLYPGRPMVRGADPQGLKAAAEELGRLAKAADETAKRGEAKKAAAKKLAEETPKEDTPSVSGGYAMGAASGGRSDWKMSLRG